MNKSCDSYISCEERQIARFSKNSYPILECSKCGHRFIRIQDSNLHLSKVYSDEYFFAGNDGYPNYLNERDLLHERGTRYARIVSKYTNPGIVLDVGCAAGFILKGFEEAGWRCRGIEPNKTMAAYGRDKLNLEIETGSIETFECEETFDLVNMIQVVGHVYDPDKALQNITRLLKPNGLVLVESWNMNSFVARIMGKRWHEYSPPSVMHWYSDKTLSLFFEYYGLKLIDKGYPVKKISLEHAFSFLSSKTSNPLFKGIVKSINGNARKLALIYPLFDVKWYIFRKDAV